MKTTDQSARSLTLEVLPPEPDPRALNTYRHGIQSEHIPAHERDAYAAHVQALRESLGVVNYLEARLADRAALALWRLGRVARYEAALASYERREVVQTIEEGKEYGRGASVTKAYLRLEALTYETGAAHRQDPGLSEREAQRLEGCAAAFDTWAAGGEVGELDGNTAAKVGEKLARLLLAGEASAAQMVRAMMGRAPRRGEADSVQDGDWEYEPGELPGLLAFARQRWGRLAGLLFGKLADAERREAQNIRTAQREAEDTERDALNLAALPDGKTLEKIARYEAHLERGLYRALHELEAMRRTRAGQDTPGPLRGVLGEES